MLLKVVAILPNYMNPIRNWNDSKYRESNCCNSLHEPYKELKRFSQHLTAYRMCWWLDYMNPIRNWNSPLAPNKLAFQSAANILHEPYKELKLNAVHDNWDLGRRDSWLITWTL